MLTMTPTAVEAVRRISDASGLVPDAGLRIFPGEQVDGSTALALEVTAGPEASDQTVEDAGATVYVDDALSDFLDAKVLDAYAALLPAGAHLDDVRDWQKRLRGEMPSLLDKTKGIGD